MRPVIGIIACNRDVGADRAQAAMTRYVQATMRHAAVDALLIPALPELVDIPNLTARLDGVLLTGSPSNIAPEYYRGDGSNGPFDPGRDAVAMALVDAAFSKGQPLFGICRGFQEINVALGGTLRTDVGHGTLPHHAPANVSFDAMFEHRHRVRLSDGGILTRAFGRSEIDVNSVHYQGVDKLAPSLTVEAVSEDGLIEAVGADAAPLLAVQWHPEWSADDDPVSARFFQLLGAATRGVPFSEFVP